jgi:hypothetical protein
LAEPYDLVIDLADVVVLIEQWDETEQWRY